MIKRLLSKLFGEKSVKSDFESAQRDFIKAEAELRRAQEHLNKAREVRSPQPVAKRQVEMSPTRYNGPAFGRRAGVEPPEPWPRTPSDYPPSPVASDCSDSGSSSSRASSSSGGWSGSGSDSSSSCSSGGSDSSSSCSSSSSD